VRSAANLVHYFWSLVSYHCNLSLPVRRSLQSTFFTWPVC
jgi:hypothetical protein